MTYNPNNGTVTTKADESMTGLDKIDLDMVVKIDETKESFGERQVFVKDRGEDDSVSTFQSKRAPPSKIATSTSKKAKMNDNGTTKASATSTSSKSSNTSTSSTSTLSMTTKNSMNTMHTRITAIEQDMKEFQSEVSSKVDLILQSMNIQQPGQVVTPMKNIPTPTKNNTTNTTNTTLPTGNNSNNSEIASVTEDQQGSSKTS